MLIQEQNQSAQMQRAPILAQGNSAVPIEGPVELDAFYPSSTSANASKRTLL